MTSLPALAVGSAFTVTVTAAVAVVEPSDAVTVYTVVAVGVIAGSLSVELNPAGLLDQL